MALIRLLENAISMIKMKKRSPDLKTYINLDIKVAEY
jgi:hypothetical protein